MKHHISLTFTSNYYSIDFLSKENNDQQSTNINPRLQQEWSHKT